MSVAGHHHVLVATRQSQQRLLHATQTGSSADYDLAGVQAHVQRDLVIAGASCVQPSGGRADELVQAALYVHVQVFERCVPREVAALDFPLDQLQSSMIAAESSSPMMPWRASIRA